MIDYATPAIHKIDQSHGIFLFFSREGVLKQNEEGLYWIMICL
jgi:hypothetical protein